MAVVPQKNYSSASRYRYRNYGSLVWIARRPGASAGELMVHTEKSGKISPDKSTRPTDCPDHPESAFASSVFRDISLGRGCNSSPSTPYVLDIRRHNVIQAIRSELICQNSLSPETATKSVASFQMDSWLRAVLVSNLFVTVNLAAYQRSQTLLCQVVANGLLFAIYVFEHGDGRTSADTPDVGTLLAVGYNDTMSNGPSLIGLIYVKVSGAPVHASVTYLVAGNFCASIKYVHALCRKGRSTLVLFLPTVGSSNMIFMQLAVAVLSFAFPAAKAGPASIQRRTTCADGNVVANGECCALFRVRDDLQNNLFNNECGDEAHEAIRLTFHDAIAISPALEAEGQFGGGGADGSIILFSRTETAFQANVGLDEVVETEIPFLERSGMGVADFIQFAGAVALTNCPGAPVLNVSIGRVDDDVDKILNRFNDAGEFDELETVWFLIAHSVAAQNDIDPTIPRTPFDSTPSIMDGQFFIETQLKGLGFPGDDPGEGEALSPLAGEFRLQSDFLLARDNRTACEWQSFGTDQAKLQNRFQFIFQAMGQLGQNVSNLIDCSDVLAIPPPLTTTPHLPAGKTLDDVQPACADTPFPSLTADPGPATRVATVPRD
ncbi:hypothetical protein NM688_g4025 [Phlebia brevispora]|uniref:Uncharacterized protein n=1 Tax=Phlebia brevispora TaxID=194682 RepID=A0ACC1T4A3_9APHY|nr:hypothetical protein NM688_g4025 [Phlebia brevispora]